MGSTEFGRLGWGAGLLLKVAFSGHLQQLSMESGEVSVTERSSYRCSHYLSPSLVIMSTKSGLRSGSVP